MAQDTTAPQPATAPAELPPVPNPWPGAFGAYKYSKAAVKFNLQPILILFILSIFVSASFASGSGLQTSRHNYTGAGIGDLIGLVFSMVSYVLYFAGVRRQKLSLGQAFRKCSVIMYLKLLATLILTGILVGISLLLLIVPFFFVMPRLLLAPYNVVDKGAGPIEAIKQSWHMTRGHAGKVWGIIGASIAMALLALTIIGIPFAIYFLFMYGAVYVVLYEYITRTAPAATDAQAQ